MDETGILELSGADAQGAVVQGLHYICDRTGSRGVALLALVGPGVDATYIEGRVNLTRLARVRAQLTHAATATKPLAFDGYALVAVIDDDQPVGVLFLDSPQSLEVPTSMLPQIGRALLLMQDSQHDVQRDERTLMLRAIQHNEWNVSRLARAHGVSRVTIYKRLARLGIPIDRTRRRKP